MLQNDEHDPTVAEVVLLSLVLLTSALLSGCKESETQRPTNHSNAKAEILQHTRLRLPETAAQVYFDVAIFMTKCVYVRFDIPEQDLDGLFAKDSRLPRPAEFKHDPKLLQQIQQIGSGQTWWDVPKLSTPTCATSESGGANERIQWSFSICKGGRSDGPGVRVYMIYTEEATSVPAELRGETRPQGQ